MYQGFLDSPEAAVSSGWGSDSVSSQLKVVANIIAAHRLTGSEREVFFVRYSGWDTHGSVDFPGTAAYPGKWDNVETGLSKFVAEMKSLGVSAVRFQLSESETVPTLVVSSEDGSRDSRPSDAGVTAAHSRDPRHCPCS